MKKEKQSKRGGVIGILILASIFLALFLRFIMLPVISINNFGTLFLGLIVALPMAAALWFITRKKIVTLIIPLGIVLTMVVNLVLGTGIVNGNKRREMIGDIKDKNFSEEISPIDLKQLPTIDQKLAQNLGDKKLGEQVALGSQVTLGDFTKQNINNELYWVAPLLHSGFFKWMNNKEGTPGYIMISATNQSDVRLVQDIDGKEIKIKYQPNAFFGEDLRRHVYLAGFDKVGLTDFSFELDDTGNPYWVITKYDNTIGFGGSKVLGVITVDAASGEIQDYNMDSIPEWVDRVIPVNFVFDQLDDWGRYINGWWNPSKKDIIKPTDGYNLVYNNGQCFYYTGMTSAGSDESTVGFMLTNTRTKETTFYKVSGSQEIAAMESAEGQVQEKQYSATFPILINIDGQATYFTTLKDKKGLVKLYAMVNVKDYSIVGVGESLSKTKSNYIKKLKNTGRWQSLNDGGEMVEGEYTIKRIGSTVVDGTTYYYMYMIENDSKIFVASVNVNGEVPLTRDGDKVKISFYDNDNTNIDVMEFDNMEIGN